MFALNYYLMENGFTPINMPVKREQYCTMVADCLKGQNQEVFYNFLMQAGVRQDGRNHRRMHRIFEATTSKMSDI